MIRVATLDRQPMARAGIAAVLRVEPDVAHVGAAADREGLLAILQRTRVDVVVLDHLRGGDGLELCLRVARTPGAPRILVFAADPGPHAVVQAALAGAEAIVDKAASVDELLETIRVLAAGERALPAVTLRRQRSAAALLAPQDRAIFAMRLSGTPVADIGSVVGLHPARVRARLAAIVAVLDGAPTSIRGALRAAA